MAGMKGLSARFSNIIHRHRNANNLCEICKGINLEDNPKDGQPGQITYKFGTLRDVKKRSSCPLCQLIINCILDESVIHWQPMEYYETHEIRVIQQPQSNKQGRRGLSCQPLPLSSRLIISSDLKGFDRIVSGKQIDFDVLSSWLDTCQNDHTKCRYGAPSPHVDTSFFRAIDVHKLCIVPIPITSEYIALSYVWGGAPPYMLLKGNKDELMSPLGLKAHWEEIPLTIRDSIELVRNLGQRYLWVDSICLTQDDDEDKGKGIMAMDLVYELSLLTIVAGGGIDANSGLPGVRPGSRGITDQVTAEVLPGIQLVLRHTVDDLLRAARYSGRGWTFQEYYLSRRRLVFINDTVYFKCHEGYWSEVEDGLLVRPDSVAGQGQVLHKLNGDVFHMLGQLLVKYSTRSLTNQNDAVNAMLGVCRRIADHTQCPLLLGIPVIAFDWFILFYPSITGMRRRKEFPSWAWSGWIGEYYYSSGSGNVAKWQDTCTWIVWYKRDQDGHLSPVRDEETTTVASDSSCTTSSKKSFEQLCDISRVQPSQLLTMNHRPYPVLQFWTVSVRYALRQIDRDNADNMMWAFGIYWTQATYEVLDRTGSNCGFVSLDSGSPERGAYDNVELIVIADSPEKVSLPGDGHQVQSQMTDIARFCWVLWIEWDGEVAERKGIGKIYRDALFSATESGAQWKEICLA
ncbi:heterokaryon incompatibility protein-domain-containing protein [Biscogniauxia mediterranea]|nr:heterokaryon incompatibility protein-domain-containing protein [Biscogniauxia mediterranea]